MCSTRRRSIKTATANLISRKASIQGPQRVEMRGRVGTTTTNSVFSPTRRPCPNLVYPTPIPKTLYIMYHGPNWQSDGRMVLTTGRLYNTKAWAPLSPVKVQPSQSPGSTPPSRQDYTIATAPSSLMPGA
jgi:hypothetical protein